MTNRRLFTAASLAIILLLTACNLPRPNATTETPGDPIGTAAAQTVAALSTQLQPKDTVTPAQVQTNPPAQTATQPAQTTAETTPAKTCDAGEFVTDVTVPDGTSFTPGQTFTKTWRLKNTGSCTWTTSYRVIFDSGNSLGAPASFNLPTSVPPDAIVDISVQMKAPDAVKEYESHWKLQNASGVIFGLGDDGQKSFWVKIKVETAVLPFAITKVVVSADNASFTGACPHTVALAAALTSTAAGRATYFWERSDGTKGAVQEVVFDTGGTKTVNSSWQFGSSFDGTVAVYIDNPNHQYFPNFALKVTCN